jgi:hypothetical protein
LSRESPLGLPKAKRKERKYKMKKCPFGNTNKMFIRKVEHGSKIVWLGSWLNMVGQPTGDQFSTLKLAKQRANEIGIPFEVSKFAWRSI